MVNMGTVWDRTAEFLSDNIGAVVPVALLAFLVPSSISGSFQTVIPTASPQLALGLRLVQLAFAILSIWGSLAISAMALGNPGGGTSGAIARRRLLPALAVSVALGAAIMALMLPVPLFLAANGYDLMAIARSEQVPISAGTGGTILAYVVILLLVLLWLSARLIVVTPIIVQDKLAFGAIPASWRLTRGSAWRIIGVLILFGIVAFVSGLAAKTVFGTVFELVAGGSEDGISLASILTSTVTAAVQTAFMVLLPAFTAKLYLALSAHTAFQTRVPGR